MHDFLQVALIQKIHIWCQNQMSLFEKKSFFNM